MTPGPPREKPPADPEAPQERLAKAAALLRQGGQGDRLAARALLASLERTGGVMGRAALGRLATLDENEGHPEEAIRRWQLVLAEDIDDDEAWANLRRLEHEAEPGLAPAATGRAAPTLEGGGAGVRLLRFEILGELGRGSFATVYKARDRQLGLELAVKVMHPRGAGARALRSDEAYFAEMRAAAGLRHPGIVAIYDVDAERRTVVMELILGTTLRERLRAPGFPPRGERLPADELGRLAPRLLSALGHLHAHGMVHGDLSPRNVLLRAPGDPVLIDFGGARLGEKDDQPAGTPLYLAPEQFAGAPASPAADLFAAGAILWEAHAGTPLRTREDLLTGRTQPRPLAPYPAPPSPLLARLGELIAGLVAASPGARAPAAAAALDDWPLADHGPTTRE